MHASQRCCNPRGCCACKDGGRGPRSWHLGPGALQCIRQSQGLMQSPFYLCEHQLFFPPSPGTVSHFFHCLCVGLLL